MRLLAAQLALVIGCAALETNGCACEDGAGGRPGLERKSTSAQRPQATGVSAAARASSATQESVGALLIDIDRRAIEGVRHLGEWVRSSSAVALVECRGAPANSGWQMVRVLRAYKGGLRAGSDVRIATPAGARWSLCPGTGSSLAQADQKYFAVLWKTKAPHSSRPAAQPQAYRMNHMQLEVPWPNSLAAYELVVSGIQQLDRAESSGAEVAALRPLLRSRHSVARMVGWEESFGSSRSTRLRPETRSALVADLVQLIEPGTDEGIVEYAAASALDHFTRHARSRTDPGIPPADRVAAGPVYRRLVEQLVALATAPASTPHLRLVSCIRLAEARTFIEDGRGYSPTGLPGDPTEATRVAYGPACRAAGTTSPRDPETCLRAWWGGVESDAVARWRAWHAGGGHLKAVVPAP